MRNACTQGLESENNHFSGIFVSKSVQKPSITGEAITLALMRKVGERPKRPAAPAFAGDDGHEEDLARID